MYANKTITLNVNLRFNFKKNGIPDEKRIKKTVFRLYFTYIQCKWDFFVTPFISH